MKFLGFVLAIVFLAPTVLANTVIAPQTPPEALQDPLSIDWLIHESSIRYGVSEALERNIIACESGFNPTAVGDFGTSFGLVQIHLPAHPEVTRQEAENPQFAVDFLARGLSEGQGSMWSCYRLLEQK